MIAFAFKTLCCEPSLEAKHRILDKQIRDLEAWHNEAQKFLNKHGISKRERFKEV